MWLFYCVLLAGLLSSVASGNGANVLARKPRAPLVMQDGFEQEYMGEIEIMRTLGSGQDTWVNLRDDVRSIAAGFMLARRADLNADIGLVNWTSPLERAEANSKLSEILDRDGPDMRPSRDYHDFKDITLDIARRAWELLHENTRATIWQRLRHAWPVFDALLREAKVSAKCHRSVARTLGKAKQMRSWAVKLINSWGSFPTSAIFEGTYGDPGAFHTCVGIKRIQGEPDFDHAHYCSVTFRPVLPSRPDYALIVSHEPAELRDMFEQSAPGKAAPLNESLKSSQSTRDAFSDLLEHAQYNHFVYYKWGTCWPASCSPIDVRRLAKLVGRRNVLLNGPVKCYSLNQSDYERDYETVDGQQNKSQKLILSIWDKNQGIFIWKPHFTWAQKVARALLLALATFIGLMSLLDLLLNRGPGLWRKLWLALRALPLHYDQAIVMDDNHRQASAPSGGTFASIDTRTIAGALCKSTASFSMVPTREVNASATAVTTNPYAIAGSAKHSRTFLAGFIADCSLFTNLAQFFRVSQGQMKNDILCLNGIRCITMIWIIMTHTMMYNDWSAFARTREVEIALNSLISQPLFSGSYLVDTFFLMSGLLSAFTAFKHCQGLRAKFNSFAYIFGRWLRLTPQIFFVALLYIIFPALSYGPHWFPIVGEYSENCVKNWWINVLHLQAFFKKEEMCNFVTWWISIDFFYHFFALAVIWIILVLGHKTGLGSMTLLVGSQIVWQSWRHYDQRLPPNVLSTIPQTGAMWTQMTLDFFWTPYTHSVPFFFGFYIGYLMAIKKKLIMRNLNTRRALIGWFLSVSLLIGQSYSTYWWVTGKATYSPIVSTLYYGACSIIWSGSLCWIIVACHHGYGGFIDRVLSWKVLFIFFGNQNLLLEPTTLNMIYIIFGNILLSTLYGIFLCAIFELPWLKIHRRLMAYV